MPSDLADTTGPPPSPKGWASRLFGGRGRSAEPSHRPGPHLGEIDDLARRLVAEGRYAFVLRREAADDLDERDAGPAWRAIDERMALVPGGVVPVVLHTGAVAPTEVPAFFLDRTAVTNEQFRRFVVAGGYEAMEIWPRAIWPSLLRFVDRTERPGPRDWQDGQFPAGQGDHPVVGVCWYEADAFARWVGKHLPASSQWQKAGGWPEHLGGGACHRYPWGDVFSPDRANVWATGKGQTVPVGDFRTGATPNGILQMSGNVWEWLDDPLEAIPCRAGESLRTFRPLRRIAGGAFDTYLPGEATCQFITGQPELDRRGNLGFRCAVGADRLRPLPDSSPEDDDR